MTNFSAQLNKNKLVLFTNYLNLISAFYLLFTLAFYANIRTSASIFFYSTFILDFIVEKRWESLRISKTTLYFSSLILFFLLIFIYYPLESDLYYYNKLIEKRFSLLAFGAIGILGLNSQFKLKHFLVMTAAIAFGLVVYLIAFKIGVKSFIFDNERALLLTEARKAFVNSHMGFNLFLNCALISIWYILSKKIYQNYLSIKVALIIMACVILGALLISEGRGGVLATLMLMGSIIIYEIIKRKKALGIVIAVTIPVIIGIAFTQHKRMSPDAVKVEPRLFLWKNSVEIIKESPIIGYGASSGQKQVDIARLKTDNPLLIDLWKNNKLVDCHNQFIQTTIEFGIIGLLLILFIYFYPIVIVSKERRALLVLFIIVCINQSIFDMFLTGQFGLNFGLMICLILGTSVEASEKIEKA